MNEEVLKKLYESGSKYYELPAFDQFKQDMQNKESALKFKQSMSQHYDMPDDGKFLSDIGIQDAKKKEDSTLDQELMVSKPKEDSSDISQEDKDSFEIKDYLQPVSDFLFSLSPFGQAAKLVGLNEIDIINSVEKGIAEGFTPQEVNATLYSGKKLTKEDAKKLVDASKRLEEVGPSKNMIQFQKDIESYDKEYGKTAATLFALGKNPQVAPEVVLTSMIAMGPAMLANPTEMLKAIGAGAATGAALGSAAGGVGAIPGAIGGAGVGFRFGTNFLLDNSLSVIEFMKEELKGKPFTPENVYELMENEEALDRIKVRAAKRGNTIGVVESIFAGFGKALPPKLTAVTEVAAGGFGELGAQIAADQEIDPTEIILESVGGIVGVPGILAEQKISPVKINGENVNNKDAENVIKNTPAEDLKDMDVNVPKDNPLHKEYKEKVDKQKISEEISPDVPEQNRKQVVDLEYERKQLEGKKTVSAKEKIKEIDQKIKELSRPKEGSEVVAEETVETELVKPELESKLTYQTSNQTQVTLDESGKFQEAVDLKTGKKRTKETARKAQNELIAQRDYTTGKSAFDGVPEGQDVGDPSQFIANESENAQEIAQEYKRKKEEGGILDPVIDAFLGKYIVSKESLKDYYGSTDDLKLIRAYTNKKKGKTAMPLDVIAMQVSEEAGREVTPAELFDIMMDPKYKSNSTPKEADIVTELRNRFIEITGFDGTDAQIDAIAKQDPSKIKPTPEPSEVTQERAERVKEQEATEDAFYKRNKETEQEQQSIEKESNELYQKDSKKNIFTTTLDSVKKFLKTKFTVLGGRTKAFRAIQERFSNNLREIGYKIETISKKYDAALKSIENIAHVEKAKNLAEAILSGAGITEQELADAKENNYIAVIDIAKEMRNYINAMSEEILTVVGGNMTKAQRQKVKNNIGYYLNRSYRLFEDKNYTPTQNAVDNFKRYMSDNATEWVLNSGETLSEAAFKLSETSNIPYTQAEEIVTSREVDVYLSEDVGFNNVVSESKGINKSILKKLKNVPEELREFYGEITEPEARFRNTVVKMASLIERVRFQESIKKDGLGVYLFTEQDVNRPKTHNVKIAGDNSQRFSPLAGLYTTQEIADIISPSSKSTNKFMSALLKLNSFVKGGKTVYSIASHPRNYISNISIMFYNGHMNLSDLWRNTKEVYWNEVLRSGKIPKSEYIKKREKYLKLGLIGQSVRFGDYISSAESLFSEKGFYESVNNRFQENSSKSEKLTGAAKKAGKAFGKGKELLESSYQAGDDIFKITAFEVEKRQRMKALGLTEENISQEQLNEIENEVAEYIRDVYPTYDRVPIGIKAIGRTPLTGSFVSFTSEMFRTSWNTFTKADELSKSDNKELRKLGKKKKQTAIIYGLLKATAYTTLYGSLKQLAFGDDDDELQDAKDLRNIVADWSKNSRLFITEKGNGKITYIDLSSNDAHGLFAKMLQAGISEDNWKQKIPQLIDESIGSFIEPEILLKAVVEINENKKSSGAPVYKENDVWYTQVSKSLQHIFKATAPGTVLTLDRIIDQDRSTIDELIGITGFRPVTINLNESFGYKAYRMANDLSTLKRDFASEKRALERSDSDIEKRRSDYKDLYKRYNDLYQEKMRENIRIINSFQRLGGSPQYVKGFKRFSKKDRLSLITGQIYSLK